MMTTTSHPRNHGGPDENDPNVRKHVQKKLNHCQRQKERPVKVRKSLESSLPPGQTKGQAWLVLDIRPSRFHFAFNDAWRLQVVHGSTTSYIKMSDIQASKDVRTLDAMDFHCVTSWSFPGLRLRGIPVSSLLAPIVPIYAANAKWKSMVQYGADKYSTSLPRAAVEANEGYLVFEVEESATGERKPLGHEHGSVRIWFPRLYGYKSAKWLVRLEFCDEVVAGFWETKGYHAVGEAILEQRFSDEPAGTVAKTIMNPFNAWFSWYAMNFPANFLAAQQCLSLDIRQTLFNWRFYWMILTFWACFPLYGLFHGGKLMLKLVLKGQVVKFHAE
ncbi:hypothetical protein H310_00743 [Aphanomyces invadans]|uniref:Oxidoreductase molybdopterin-binding domain-containing protein n=1 Tax=Aphanomyces invadans TaxID=157072 RepID=A0A024UXP5_9STRA|nr:hypothetical protein H310_00743 [Aphanomyces invadans]ETW10438.1 hypothetical protein H310_00743 [Aphanomyces invadans]|eukprot:XP_008861849.1 hypothetical protein H310_00743 [Aphanomyces invadans]